MNKTMVFPTVLIILNILASLVYLTAGAYWKTFYFLCAGLITLCALMM